MMKTYSHIRRAALDEAANVLEPTFTFERTPPEATQEVPSDSDAVMSQATSQSACLDDTEHEIIREIGSSGWTRTSNPPVNSRMLCH